LQLLDKFYYLKHANLAILLNFLVLCDEAYSCSKINNRIWHVKRKEFPCLAIECELRWRIIDIRRGDKP